MLGDIDKNLKPYEYRLFLCKPDRTPIAELPEAYNKNLKLNYGSIHELSFILPFKIEKNKKFIRNKHVDMLRGHYLIRLERKRKDGLFLDKEYFIITKPKNITDNGKEAKHVQSYLLPYEIRDKIVRRYSGTKKLKEVLAETLEYKTDWTVGHVDLDVSEKYRTFDESQTNLLDFLYKVAETFDVVIKWDTENKIVNFYKNESYGNDRGLLIEYGKYLKTLDEEPDFDNVVTRLYCYGKDDLSIRSVNPSGMDYIESFDYYMYPFERDDNRNILKHSNYMSDELCHAILDYNDLLESKKGEFNNLLLQKQAKQELLTQKQNELIVLNNELKIILDNIDIANANNQPTSDLILQKTAKETEITTKQSEINQINTEINNIDIQISNLRNIIAIENNFTPELIIERNQFIKEYVWSDNNYIDVQELYDDGINKLKIISQPLVSYQIDIIDFLKVVECQRDWEKLIIGDIITIRYPNFNIDIKAKIIGIENSLDDYNIKLTIANSKDVASGFLTLNEMINRSYSSSIQVDMSKYKWNEADSKATEIEQVINQTWDATARNIKAGVNNSVEINERGIRIVDPSDPQNILIAQHGILAISNDGGLSWKHAISANGIVGEQIYGKLGTFAKVRADQIIVGDAGEKITDDIIDSSGKWNDMEQNAKTYIDTQVTQLNDSLSELDNTITNAFSDNSITNIEAQSLNLARNSIVKEAEDVKNIASALSISTTALNTAIANLNTEVDKYVGKTNYPIEVTATDRTNLTNAFTALEGAVVQLYKAIDEKRINNIDTSLTNYIDGISNDLTELIDEKIDTWFYAVTPTLNNPPANSWTTDIIKDKHLNDLYYNTTNGYTYRFVKVDGVYAWEKIEDKDIADAMAKASKAQDTADGKRTIFTTTPTVPYDVGDLWRVTNVDGVDFKICITAKDENGSYSSSDWANVSNAKTYIDTQVTQLNDSLSNLETEINSYSSDLKLTLAEANTLKISLDSLNAESTDLINVATSLSITTEKTNYSNALTTLTNYLNTYWLGKTYPLTITSAQRTNVTNYFKNVENYKSILVNKIIEIRDGTSVKKGNLYNGVKITQSGGIEVYDNLNKQRVQLGNYATGKYGLLLKDTTGNVTMVSEDGVLQTWQEGRADNVASGKPLILNVYLPSNTKSVHQAILRFRRQSFRAYSTGAASGGGQTSGSSSTSTTSGGGDHRHQVYDYVGTVSENKYLGTQAYEFRMANSSGGTGANFFIKSPAGTTSLYTRGASGTHTHGMAHTHSISNHTHDIIYGIYEGTSPTNITIKINGTDRTSILGGGTGFNSDQSNLNITSYLSIGQWNTIELGSSRLGRLDATVFIQALMGV